MLKRELGIGIFLFFLLIIIVFVADYRTSDNLQQDIEALLVETLGEKCEILNYDIFDDFIVVFYKDNDKINRRIFMINYPDLKYVSGYDDIKDPYYGTIQKYNDKIYLVVTGIAEEGQSIEVFYNGLENMQHKLFSQIYEIQNDYFIIIDQLYSESGFEFLVDNRTKIIENYNQND